MIKMELVPGQLTWAPECLDRSKPFQVSVYDFLGEKGGMYQVQHYTAKGQGRAFGPLGLSQTLEFCKQFQRHMKDASLSCTAEVVELSTPPGNPEKHTNAAVIVGAYLILCLGFSSRDVQKVMGDKEAKRKFACSWARADRPEVPRNMEVADCWLGVELAVKQNWLPQFLFSDDDKYKTWVSNYSRMLVMYDATWIAPGAIMVSADPSTTAQDPNPSTCSSVFPLHCKEDVNRSAIDLVLTKVEQMSATEPDSVNGRDHEHVERETKPCSQDIAVSEYSTPPGCIDVDLYHCSDEEDMSDLLENASVDTVCKAYSRAGSRSVSKENERLNSKPIDTSSFMITPHKNSPNGFALDAEGMLKPFVTFLQEDCAVALVIRTNDASEPGMTAPYDGKKMLDYEIVHEDLFVDDHGGGMPSRSAMRSAVDLAKDYMHLSKRGDAILVHCKGGFGRSVVLACSILVDRYGISGRALLGWLRIIRPGAVTTPQQELFLRSLTGREDLHRFLAMGSGQPACGCNLM